MAVKNKITAVITAFVLSVSCIFITAMADETNIEPTPIPTISPVPTDDINITIDGKRLVKDVDYKLTYRDNINVGTATVVVTFIGNYSGQKEQTFNIVRKKSSSSSSKKDNTKVEVIQNNNVLLTTETSGDVNVTIPKNIEYNSVYKVIVTVKGVAQANKDVEIKDKYGRTLRGRTDKNGVAYLQVVSDETPKPAVAITPTPTAQSSEIHKSYISGYDDNTFRPDGNITRAETAAMLYRVLTNTKSGESISFSDIKESAWYYESVTAMSKAGIINGYTDGTFRPDNPITRAEFVTMIMQNKTLTEFDKIPFTDVKSDLWSAKYIYSAYKAKYIDGYEDNTFRPDNQITQEEFVKTVVALTVGEQPEATGENTEPKRSWKNCWDSWAQPYLNKAMEMGLITEEDTDFRYNGLPCTRGNMAKIATRAFEYLKEEDIADTSTYATKLKDYSDIPDKFKKYVLQAYGKGIISGYEDGTFRSDGILTRAEASSVLVRLIDKAERPNADETLYDYFGRKVTFTEPLRTDVPEQYQVSIADHKVLSQANYNESVQLGGTPSDYPLNRSKAMMFEDLVLQSIRYDGDTITLTVPDYLPESQRWVISVGYWETDKDCDMTNVKNVKITEPGEYSFSGVKLMGGVIMTIKPQNSNSFTSLIEVTYEEPLSSERLDKPEVSFNNMHTHFEWVQGQGYKDYIKDFDGEIAYPVEW